MTEKSLLELNWRFKMMRVNIKIFSFNNIKIPEAKKLTHEPLLSS
jgi:hypothetical protein